MKETRNVLPFRRTFRDRIELVHTPDRKGAWIFSLDHVSKFGRSHIGDYDDVEHAFIVATAWRSRGISTVAVTP